MSTTPLLLPPATLAGLIEIIHLETGIALGPDKHYLFQHRIAPLLKAHHLVSFDQLLARLRSRAGTDSLRADLIDAIANHETSFFRDPEVFATIASHAIAPALAELARAARQRPMRIWSAATSTGQEAWSLAILVAEILGPMRSPQPLVSILATDISPHTLEVARRGRYSARELARGVSEQRVRARFRPLPGGTEFVVHDALREFVQFRTFNLLAAPTTLGQFDLILCRNVLIYFDEETRARVVHAIADALVPGGHLVLGAAESLFGLGTPPGPRSVPIAAKLQPVYFPKAILYQRTSE